MTQLDVTGSVKTGLIAQDSKLDFFAQIRTKLYECTIKFHCHSLLEESGLLLLTAFSSTVASHMSSLES